MSGYPPVLPGWSVVVLKLKRLLLWLTSD